MVVRRLLRLRERLQLIESRQASFGRELGALVEAQQMPLGAAKFDPPGRAWPFGAARWTQIAGDDAGGPWRKRHFEKTKALAVHDDRLFVGVSLPGRESEIWAYDGSAWQLSSASRAKGHRGGYVAGMVSDGKTLFAGIDDLVWAYDRAGGWRQIGGDGLAGSWPGGAYISAYAVALWNGTLCAGMKSRDQAAVFAYDGGRWEKIGGDGVRGSWNDRRYTGVYELWPHTDGELYVGLIGRPGPSAVHRYDGSRWEQVAGDGLRDSWRNAGATHPFSFASYQGRLVVSMNRHPLIAGQFSSVWSFDGEAWRPVGVGRIPSAWGRMHNYNALAVYRDHLLIGAGGDPAGYASVWSLDGDGGLRQIGGAGLLGSWDGSDQRARVRRVTSTEYVYRLVEWRDSVIAGFGTGRNMAQLWRLDAPAPPPG